MVNTSTIELPPDDRLTSEFFSMEARPTASGQSRIAASGSAHDDMVSAVAAAVAQLGNTISSGAMDSWRELISDLATSGDGRLGFSDVIGVPGLPDFGVHRL